MAACADWRVSCVITADELGENPADLIVFPEGSSLGDITAASSLHQNSIVVGAIEDGDYCRGVLYHQGKSRIDYLKVEGDGRTKGSGKLKQNPVFEHGSICIGVLVCMDIDHPEFSRNVIEKLKCSSAKTKALCVPADMGSHWDILRFPSRFEGIHVILCNNTKTYQGVARCPSFISNSHGKRIKTQILVEPLHDVIP